MKKKIFYPLVATFMLVAITLWGCKKEDKEDEIIPTPPPTNEVSVKGYTNYNEVEKVEMKKDVVFVKEDIDSQIKQNDTINKRFILNNSSVLDLVKTGDVMYKPFTEDQGYAVRVKRIEKQGNDVIYHYEEVTPFDVFDKLEQKTDFTADVRYISPIPEDEIISENADRPSSSTARKRKSKEKPQPLEIKLTPNGGLEVDLGEEGITLYKDLKLLEFKATKKDFTAEFSLSDIDGKKNTTWDRLGFKLNFTYDFSKNSLVFDNGIFDTYGLPKLGHSIELTFDLSQLKEFDSFKGSKQFFDNVDKTEKDIKNWLNDAALDKEWRKMYDMLNQKDKSDYQTWKEFNKNNLFKDFRKDIAKKMKERGLLGKKIPLLRVPLVMKLPTSFNILPSLDIYAIFDIDIKGELVASVSEEYTYRYRVMYLTNFAKKALNADKNFETDLFLLEDHTKYDFSLMIDAELEAKAGLGVGVTMSFPWSYANNENSYIGVFADLTLKGKLAAAGGFGIGSEQGYTRCKEATITSQLTADLYLEGKLGIFEKKLYEFHVGLDPIVLAELPVNKINFCNNRFLTLSKKEVALGKGGVDVLTLLGNEDYEFSFDKEGIAQVLYDKEKLKITGLEIGETTLTITDKEIKKKEKIKIKVNEGELLVDKQQVVLESTKTATVQILKGSGKYQIVVLKESNEQTGQVTANISGNTITLTGKVEGNTTLQLKDLETLQTQTISVTVNAPTQNLVLSKTALTLNVNQAQQVQITAGSGDYVVKSNQPNIATIELTNNHTLTITGKAQGTATLSVRDKQSGQTQTISVTVNAPTQNLVLSKTALTLNVNQAQQVQITAGSGDYAVKSNQPNIATIELTNNHTLTITGKAQGTATLSVRDKQSGQTQTISVSVNAPTQPQVPDGVVIENGVLKKWPCDKIPADGHVVIPDGVTAIGERTFFRCSSLKSVVIPDGVISIENGAFEECDYLKSVMIPNSVTSIGNRAFYDCRSLTSITLPNSVTAIGNSAFNGCSSLTSITLPNSVTSIGVSAFYGCRSLTSIILPKSVNYIAHSAFRDCSSLTSINISNSVTSIEYGAFWGCSSLTSITLPNSVTAIGDYAFSGCSSLTSITLPNSVTSIGYGAFLGCSSLTSITLPDSVTSIESRAFLGCSSLTSIALPNSVTSIGSEDFRDCSSLTSITLPDSVTSIGAHAFSNCSSLTSITIPNNVTFIGSYAFQGCSSLTSITLPSSVIYITDDAFRDCSSLISLILKRENPITTMNYYRGIPSTTTIKVPAGSVDAYKTAAGWREYAHQIVAE